MRNLKNYLLLFKQKRLLCVLIFICFLLVASGLFWYFSDDMRQARQYKENVENILGKMQEQIAEYQFDSYGGATPEETYEMFLRSLEEKDIDSASRYFVSEKQDEYRQFFSDIETNGKWEDMMEDLLNSGNQQGEMKENGIYVVRIYNDENYLVAQAVLKKITDAVLDKEQSFVIWKIAEF